jgi:hypothetical protein
MIDWVLIRTECKSTACTASDSLTPCHPVYAGNCTYEAVDQINQHHLHPILTELVSTPYFRYFKVRIHDKLCSGKPSCKSAGLWCTSSSLCCWTCMACTCTVRIAIKVWSDVEAVALALTFWHVTDCGHSLPQVNLYCDCPLWPEDGMCAQRSCSVCECEPNEVPQPWLQAEKQSCEAEPVEEPCSHEECKHWLLVAGHQLDAARPSACPGWCCTRHGRAVQPEVVLVCIVVACTIHHESMAAHRVPENACTDKHTTDARHTPSSSVPHST